MAKKLTRFVGYLLFVAVVALTAYAGKAWIDAGSDAATLQRKADALIANGYGGERLVLSQSFPPIFLCVEFCHKFSENVIGRKS